MNDCSGDSEEVPEWMDIRTGTERLSRCRVDRPARLGAPRPPARRAIICSAEHLRDPHKGESMFWRPPARGPDCSFRGSLGGDGRLCREFAHQCCNGRKTALAQGRSGAKVRGHQPPQGSFARNGNSPSGGQDEKEHFQFGQPGPSVLTSFPLITPYLGNGPFRILERSTR